MSNKALLTLASFAVCLIFMNGCNATGGKRASSKSEEIEMTPAEKKKKALLRHIDRNFKDSASHFELGELYRNDGLWHTAEREYRIALQFDPAHKEAQAGRVNVLQRVGQQQKAEILQDIYMGRVSESAAGSLRLGLAFQKQNLDDAALACYEQALRLAPDSAKINRQIGYYHLSKGNTDRAMDYLKRSFNINPNQPDVANELGRHGVSIKIPRKKARSAKRLDRIVDEADRELQREILEEESSQ